MNNKSEDSKKHLNNKRLKRGIEDNKQEDQKSCSRPQFNEDIPSCSKSSSENYIAMIDPEEMKKVTEKMNKVLDECFKDKEEIKVDRYIFEELMSKTLEDYCNKYEPMNLNYALEAKLLRERCQALEAKRISLNRTAFALKKQIEDAKFITKKLIDENTMFNRGYRRRRPLPDRNVRSVSLQVGDGVCLRNKFEGLPVLPYKRVFKGDTIHCSKEPPYYSGPDSSEDESSDIYLPGCSSGDTSFEGERSVLVEDKSTKNTQTQGDDIDTNTARQLRGKKNAVDTKKSKEDVTTKKKVVQEKGDIKKGVVKETAPVKKVPANKKGAVRKEPVKEKAAVKKESVKEKAAVKKESVKEKAAVKKESVKEKAAVKKEVVKEKKAVDKEVTKKKEFAKKEIVKKKGAVDKESVKEKAAVKKEVVKEKGAVDKEVAKQKESAKKEVVKEKEAVNKEVVKEVKGVKQEFVEVQEENVAEVKIKSEPPFILDDDYPEEANFSSSNIIEDFNAVNMKAIIKKEPSEYDTEIKSETENSNNSMVKDEIIPKPYKEQPSCSNSVKTGPSVGAGSFNIKVRSPQTINEQFSKQVQNTTSSSVPVTLISLCNLPKYPISPRYPSHVPKPPAPILQASRSDTDGKHGVTLTWSFTCKNKPENIVKYELFAFNQGFHETNKNGFWKKVGDIEALPLPMACLLLHLQEENTYNFIIRAVDNLSRIGDFSLPASVALHKNG